MKTPTLWTIWGVASLGLFDISSALTTPAAAVVSGTPKPKDDYSSFPFAGKPGDYGNYPGLPFGPLSGFPTGPPAGSPFGSPSGAPAPPYNFPDIVIEIDEGSLDNNGAGNKDRYIYIFLRFPRTDSFLQMGPPRTSPKTSKPSKKLFKPPTPMASTSKPLSPMASNPPLRMTLTSNPSSPTTLTSTATSPMALTLTAFSPLQELMGMVTTPRPQHQHHRLSYLPSQLRLPS